ncbi:MAG: T9SS type A sorting domain-containing protein, partial [Bacteroidota bacterium]
LDAVLRNTDNPADGSVTEDYPLGGGAYFDVMGYHEYPHIDGSLWFYDWRTGEGPKDFQRNSDRAVENGIYRKKNEFQAVLDKYGYDGNTFPEKIWIITESNLPRKNFNDFRYYGSDEMQRNYIIKAAIGAMKTDIVQFHPFTLGDKKSELEATFEFDLMGMYQKLRDTEPYSQQVNNVGIAYKTASDLLFGTTYDEKRTIEINLPDGVEGGAFKDKKGEFVYALWAKTILDRSEEASASYSFPNAFEIEELEAYPWNWSYYNSTSFTSASQKIELTGSPLFFKVKTSSTCGCDAVYEPVCGSDGVEYSNACVAECNGVFDYESGVCEVEEEYIDIEITELSATPNPFTIFNRVTFRVEVANRGNLEANDVVLEFPIPKGELAYVNANISQGNFRIGARQWDIGSLAAGESASLDFTLFTLIRQDINVYAQVIAASSDDIDSTPNNGDGVTAQEDDETNLVIKYLPPTIVTPHTEVTGVREMKIAPNPVGTSLQLNLENIEGEKHFKILDLQGRVLQEGSFFEENMTQIDVSNLPSGVYTLVIQNESVVLNRLFVKN